MGTMSYAASLPGRKVDWRATKEEGIERAVALPRAALRGYRRAITAWSHPLASPGPSISEPARQDWSPAFHMDRRRP